MQQLIPNTLLQGGRYKIVCTLGQGGFGITYLAIQSGLERKVAIKEFFMKELCDRDEATSHVTLGTEGSRETVNRFREKFLKEARTIAGLANHHVVEIYDIFEENGTAYYVMEYAEGGSLEELVKKNALTENDALGYIKEIADALESIHAQNILHLDIKPSNALLRKNGEVVLIDFGISKRYDEQGGQTSTTPAGISKGYAPSEQYNQGIANFSPATDIYSLGATLYKLLTGVTPPEASLLLNEDAELERPENVSFSTWVAIEKAMEPRRKRRPQSITEFLQLIGNKEQPKEIIAPQSEETIVIKPNEQKDVVISQSEETILHSDDKNLTFNVNGVSFKMIYVEGGILKTKETVQTGFLGLNTKVIDKQTEVSDYYIADTQVTQELWEAVMGNNPSKYVGDKLPVESVTWYDCKQFIENLNKLTGRNFRFLTNPEWEFAARGGNKSKNYIYSGSNNPNDVAWYDGNSDDTTHPVATKAPNELGIYDMSGNVREWCEFSVKNDNQRADIRGGGFQSSCSISLPLPSQNTFSTVSKSPALGLRLAMSK